MYWCYSIHPSILSFCISIPSSLNHPFLPFILPFLHSSLHPSLPSLPPLPPPFSPPSHPFPPPSAGHHGHGRWCVPCNAFGCGGSHLGFISGSSARSGHQCNQGGESRCHWPCFVTIITIVSTTTSLSLSLLLSHSHSHSHSLCRWQCARMVMGRLAWGWKPSTRVCLCV